MRVLLRIVSVVFVAISLFLLFAVVNAVASEGGARVGVAIAYVAGAIVLIAAAVAMWRKTARRPAAAISSQNPPSREP